MKKFEDQLVSMIKRLCNSDYFCGNHGSAALIPYIFTKISHSSQNQLITFNIN